MSYSKKEFKDGDILTPFDLNDIGSGIEEAIKLARGAATGEIVSVNITNGSGSKSLKQVDRGGDKGNTFTFYRDNICNNPNADEYAKTLNPSPFKNEIKIVNGVAKAGQIEQDAVGTHSSTFGGISRAIGERSQATGSTTIAVGAVSHTEGTSTVAFGSNSHAEGFTTTAIGDAAHVEGGSTIAKGECSHAEGSYTYAKGKGSHAEGFGAYRNIYKEDGKTVAAVKNYCEESGVGAWGDYSHVEGIETAAKGLHSHAEGVQTKALGNNSHAEGERTVAKGISSHAEGYLDPNCNPDHYGARAPYSHTEGVNTTVNESASAGHAEGCKTTVTGMYSHAEGDSSTATGDCSHVEGGHSTSIGDYSHAEGSYTSARGECSHAEGGNSKAIGNYAHAEGYVVKAEGYAAHAEGEKTWAYDQSSHAEGEGGYAIGKWSHAEGYSQNKDCNIFMQEGTLIPDTGIITKWETTPFSAAIGNGSHVEGDSCLALGAFSHAGGQQCMARSERSFAHGRGLETTKPSQTVVGEYNERVSNYVGTRRMFTVGLGNMEKTKTIFEIGTDRNSNDRIVIYVNGRHYNLLDMLDAIALKLGGWSVFNSALTDLNN